MIRFAPVALATVLAATAFAQSSRPPAQFTDPANLRGERVSPRTGRELPIDKGALGLEELLRKLSTRASILNIVAHPDDEDGGMLTLYARGLGARVADLSLTRGEGGQNAATSDFEDALGLLRTQELLSNDRYTGVTQMFGTEVDFGFSKTKAESFAKWTHDRVLYDAVRAIRLYRPLVITATFIGNPTDGHGQHQVSGQIAQEAFKAAGDPSVFPELTKEGILPWQPLKMYARAPMQAISSKGLFDYATGQYAPAQFTNYVTGITSATPPAPDIVIHEGADDPLITTCAANPSDLPPQLKPASSSGPDCHPLSYVQFARIGLGLQRTQIGPGVRNARPGAFDVPYHLFGSRLCGAPVSLKNCHPERSEGPAVPAALASQPNFFDGIDTSIEGIATLAPNAPPFLHEYLAKLSAILSAATSNFDPNHPEETAPSLAEASVRLNQLLVRLNDGSFTPEVKENLRHELLVKRAQLNDALALALGLHFDATAPAADLVTDLPVKLTTRTEEKAPADLSINKIDAATEQGGETNAVEDTRANRPLTGDHSDQRTLTLAAAETLTVTRPYFFRNNIEDPVYRLRIPALRNAPATPPALVAWASIDYKGVSISLGRVVHAGDQPVHFVPPFSVALSSHAQVLPSGMHSISSTVSIQSAGDTSLKGRLLLSIAPGWTVKPAQLPLHTETSTLTLETASAKQPATLTAVAHTENGDHISEGFRPIGYGSLPRTNVYTPAIDRIVPVDLKLPPPDKRRIGYLEGTGDDVPSALASIGLKPTILTVADLTPDKLSHFDTIILGVRTYNAHPDLHGAPTAALLDFARSGGNVLVQYQTYEFTAADAPFPLELGRAEKVVDETDPVEILHADSIRFTAPNRIVTADFDHWIEERGHGFLGSWDPHYTALTETHDPGQAPQKGGLITVQLGRGHWTYCAFALYRQLPEAVPGAFRIFVNLLNP
jgi:LmbE family N-acetylglucosaminyl deacetylase